MCDARSMYVILAVFYIVERVVLFFCWQAMRRAKITIENKICLNVPLFHAFGMIMGQLFISHTGCTVVMEERSFDPVKSLEAIAREKCAITYGTPTMWVSKDETDAC